MHRKVGESVWKGKPWKMRLNNFGKSCRKWVKSSGESVGKGWWKSEKRWAKGMKICIKVHGKVGESVWKGKRLEKRLNNFEKSCRTCVKGAEKVLGKVGEKQKYEKLQWIKWELLTPSLI